jgi:ribonuclease P protein component
MAGRGVGRLKRRAEFLRVAATRRKWAAEGLILQVAAAELGEAMPRIGFTVTKKLGNAVTRNRARRRLKAAAERVMPLHAAPGHDYVAIGRAGTVERPFALLIGDFETALRRLKLWRPSGDAQ